jgi:hypothetical protein
MEDINDLYRRSPERDAAERVAADRRRVEREQFDAENAKLDAEVAAREEEEKQREAKRQAMIDPKSGKLKSDWETKDPSEFGAKENLKEAGQAIAGGAVDAVNSTTGTATKFFDPDYWKPSAEEYRPKPQWLQMEPPITRTKWGGVIRRVVEFSGLTALTRKAAGKASTVAPKSSVGKSLSWYDKGPAMVKGQPGKNIGRRLGHSLAEGVVTDAISNSSTGANVAEELIKMRPDWEPALQPFATTDEMSPATRQLYNIGEALGIQAVFDLGLMGSGWVGKAVLRGASEAAPGAAKGAIRASPTEEFIQGLRSRSTAQIETNVGLGAEQTVIRKNIADPTLPRWEEMSPQQQFVEKYKYARSKKMDWGQEELSQRIDQAAAAKAQAEGIKLDGLPDEKLRKAAAKDVGLPYVEADLPQMRRQQSMERNQTEVGVARLVDDPQGQRGFDPAINDGGDVQQQASFSTSTPSRTIEDLNRIGTDFNQRDGSPRSFVTDRWLDRMAKANPGEEVITRGELDEILRSDPVAMEMINQLRAKNVSADKLFDPAMRELAEALAGRRGWAEMGDEEFQALFKKLDLKDNNPFYADLDLVKASMVLPTLSREIRDLARAGLSVVDDVDVMLKDAPLDRLLKRRQVLARGIKESNYLRSIGLGNLRAEKADIQEGLSRIARDVQIQDTNLRKAIAEDESGETLRLLLDGFALDGRIKSVDDLGNYMAETLFGKRGYDAAAFREAGSMMIHSAISGPKTPIRAVVGTAIAAYGRPVAQVVGSTLRGDMRMAQAGAAELNAMFTGIGEGLQLFNKQLKANFNNPMGFDANDLESATSHYLKQTTSDAEWELWRSYLKTGNGSDAEVAAFLTTDVMRNLNRNSFLTWSSRVMNASDVAFRTMIGRAKARSKAYLKAYDELANAGGITDGQMPAMLKRYEEAFTQEIFDSRGFLQDEYAVYASKEATMTKDLPQMVKNIETAFSSFPLTRPFMLFARTGWNALELTTKHTPILNRFIGEVWDIDHLKAGDPKLLQYGIRTQDELLSARAINRGREAIGAAAIMAAGTLYTQGRLTGNGPSDKQLRDAWSQTGWVPRSLLIGDKWIGYDSLEPFNSLLAFVADTGDINQQMGDTWTENKLGQLWYLIQANVTSKSFLHGLAQFGEVISGGADQRLGSVLASQVNTYVPLSSMRNEIGKLFNPGMRELEKGFLDSIKNRNLWAGELADLPYKNDILNGEPLRFWDVPTRVFNAISPFQMNVRASETRRTLWRSLYDVKTVVNTMPDTEGEIPPTLKSQWNALIGQQNVEAQLEDLFKRKDIQQSILDMEQARNGGSTLLGPEDFPHYLAIDRIFRNAKKTAMFELRKDQKAEALMEAAADRDRIRRYSKAGESRQANSLEQLLSNPIK